MFESLVAARQWSRCRLSAEDCTPGIDRLTELLSRQPSAETLAEIEAYEAADLDEAGRVTMLRLWERHSAWLAARQQRAVVDVAGVASTQDADDWASVEVAAALRLSPVSGSRRVAAARALCGRLSATGRLLAAGDITFWYALSVVEAVEELDDTAAARVEAVVLEGAAELSLSRFRARLRRAVIAAAPQTADERHDQQRAMRRVVLSPEPDGMAWLSMFLTAPEAIAAYRAIDDRARGSVGLPSANGENAPVGADPVTGEYADRADGDVRSSTVDPIATLRADAFLSAVLGTDVSGQARGAGCAIETRVLVTVDLPTLLRLADNPGRLDGYGDIPPELTRRLAADGIWQRMIVDPVTGHLLDLGRSTYRPPRALVNYLHARDVTCRFPGCNRNARRCDLDHAESWQRGGSTCSANMGSLCRRHHRAKTHAGWELHSEPNGSATFTSPTGHRYRRPAIDHNPEHTAHLRQLREPEPGDDP